MAKVARKSSRMRTISFLFLLLSLTFCQKEDTSFDVAIAFPSDPPSLDPLFATDLVSQKLAKFIYASLYQFKGNSVERRLVATDTFLINPNGNRLQIELSKNIGVSADDVQFSLQRLIDSNFPRKEDYSWLKKINKLSDTKIELILDPNSRESTVKEKLALPFSTILNQKEFQTNGQFISSSEYQLKEWKKNEFILLVKRKDRKMEVPTLSDESLPKSILIRILPQSTTSLFLFKKQKIDAFKLTDFLLNLPEADERHTIVKRGRSVQYVAINHLNPCFDIHFRKALNYAIPSNLIIEKLLGNKADLVIGPVPLPFYHSLYSPTSKPIYYFDLAKAKEHLSHSKCFPKILDEELEFRMKGDDENQAKGRAIVQALADLGLKIRLKALEKATLYKENGQGKGDLTLLTWYADDPSVWNFLDPLFHPQKKGNGGNRAHYTNTFVGSILDQKESSQKARSLIHLIEEDAPWIFLWSVQENYLVSDKFIRYEGLSDYL